MKAEPVLGKAPPDPHWDYKPMTWERFLALRDWAKRAADELGAPVYLAGSSLYKLTPRDIDVAVVWPTEEFERRFGAIPEQLGTPEMAALMRALYVASAPYLEGALDAIQWVTRVDLRFCPDCWWPDKDRLLLAEPKRA